MSDSQRTQSLLLGAVGVALLAAPADTLRHVTGSSLADYEVAVLRWTALAVFGLAMIRPWAIRVGDGPARRMRRWWRVTLVAAILYVVTTNPLFLIVTFSTMSGAVLDASVERATMASRQFMDRLLRHPKGG